MISITASDKTYTTESSQKKSSFFVTKASIMVGLHPRNSKKKDIIVEDRKPFRSTKIQFAVITDRYSSNIKDISFS
jgi:hypothetical protein